MRSHGSCELLCSSAKCRIASYRTQREYYRFEPYGEGNNHSPHPPHTHLHRGGVGEHTSTPHHAPMRQHCRSACGFIVLNTDPCDDLYPVLSLLLTLLPTQSGGDTTRCGDRKHDLSANNYWYIHARMLRRLLWAARVED